MKKGDKVSLDGKQGTVGWTSDEMTDDERQEAHLRTADFLEQYGLSGAFQRLMAQRYRPKGVTMPNQWIPITEAPKDGTSVIVYLADEDFSTLATWDKLEDMFYLPAFDLWQSADGLHSMTHFMFLPEPPNIEG